MTLAQRITLLLFVLLMPIGTVYLSWMYQRSIIRHEVKEQLIHQVGKSSLSQLKFRKEEVNEVLNWEHDREFQFQGTMYDVVLKEEHGDSIYYWCWKDERETELYKTLVKRVQIALGQSQNKKDTESKLSHFYKNLFYNSIKGYSKRISEIEESKPLLCFEESVTKITVIPLVPPPEESIS